ncbi:O-antigen ligase family protein [Candidatus Gottesmanbacteria bacterium]|nr:O-antigen ligase family protein [Candidatus Gottesmanbacteria bacterium]
MKNLNNNFPSVFLPLFFLFLLLFAVNIKTFILIMLGYGVALFFFSSYRVPEIIFFLLLFSLPFEKGLRDWMVSVVPTGPELWAPGYSFYFGITLKLILTCTSILFLIISARHVRPHNAKALYILFLFVFFSMISTLTSSDITIAAIGFIRLLQACAIFVLGSYYIRKIPAMRGHFQNILISFLIFFGAIGTIQFLSGQPLGLFLEDAQGLRPFGYLTSDTGPLYRVSGLFGHPTFFGSLLSFLIPVGITRWLSDRNKKGTISKTLYGASVAVGCIAIAASLSRGAWIAVFVCFSAILWKLSAEGRNVLMKKLLLLMISTLTILAILLGPQLLARASTFTSLASLSSGRVRLDLMRQAVTITGEYPFFGTGLNLFTQAMNAHDLPPEIKGFMYPVHNTFLLFFSELGIPAGVLFLVFTAYCLITSWKKAKQNWENFGIWLGAVTFIINAQFQTLFNQDPTFDFFMVYLAFLTTL